MMNQRQTDNSTCKSKPTQKKYNEFSFRFKLSKELECYQWQIPRDKISFIKILTVQWLNFSTLLKENSILNRYESEKL